MALARRPRTVDVDSELHREIARLSVNDIEQLMPPVVESTGRISQQDRDTRLAFRLAIEEARALAAFDQDRALALRMQMGEDWPPLPVNPARARPTVNPVGRAPSTQTPAAALRNPFMRQPEINPAQPPGRTATSSNAAQAGGGWFAAMFNWWFGTTAAATTSLPPAPPPITPGSSNAAQSRRLTGHNCVSCMDPIRGVEVRTPCAHYYDKTCILDLFEAAMKDESLFPPRCCRQHIPLVSVSKYMSAASLAKFREKTQEFGTRKRVYCAKPSCSHFLGQQYEGGLAYIRAPRFTCTAPDCTTVTCSSCKNEVKSGSLHRCHAADADEHVLALGQRSGWARCPGCETMIELNMGCYHMTCRCRTEFCYLCRALWKTCTCPQWDEHRLLVAAQARADAQLRAGGVQRVPVAPPRWEPLVPAVPQVRIVVRREPPVEERVRVPVGRPATPPPAPAQNTPGTAARSHTIRQARAEPHAPDNVPVAGPSRHQTTTPGSRSTVAPLRLPVRADTQDQRKPQAANKRDRQDLVRQWVERLRVDHDCNHGKWTYRRGAGKCEVCHDHLPLYLFRCNGCEVMACRRCRWNRI